MNFRIHKFIIGIIILVITVHPIYLVGQRSSNFEISKNLEIYTSLYKELNTNYVDELAPGELMETGIDAMLKSLDPYTVFIPEAEVEDYKFITTGQYGGVGALIQQQGDYIVNLSISITFCSTGNSACWFQHTDERKVYYDF